MSAPTTPTVLDDARLIALATVSDAGGLLATSSFETGFASTAISGAWALYVLGGHEHPAVQGRVIESLNEIADRDARRAVRAYHLREARWQVEAIQKEREDAPEEIVGYETEIARAERVLAALGRES